MSIAVTCPACGAHGKAHDDKLGKAVKCRQCGGKVPVGREGTAPAPRAPQPSRPHTRPPAAQPAPPPPSRKEQQKVLREKAAARWEDPTAGPTDAAWHAGRVRESAASGKRLQIALGVGTLAVVVAMLAAADYLGQYVQDAHRVKAAAETGDEEAQYELAVQYDTGTLRLPNQQRALQWYTNAAKKGHPEAAFMLGEMYRTGRGVDVNPEQARLWYSKAALRGHEGGRAQYEKIAAGGDAEAQLDLGRIYREGVGTEPDPAEAVRWYEMAGAAGQLRAQIVLAEMYDTGAGIPADPEKALHWYVSAATLRHPPSAYHAGRMYAEGRGTAPNPAEAARWMQESADRGHDEALFLLGTWYYAGTYVEQDPARAADLLTTAADLEHTEALYWIAGLYFDGAGVALDRAHAFQLMHKAAEGGHALAQHALAIMYLNRFGVGSRDRFDPFSYAQDRAEHWLAQAAETGGWGRVPVYVIPDLTWRTSPYRYDDTYMFIPEHGLVVRDLKLRRKFPPPV